MCFIWFITLVIYGFASGFNTIDPLLWWLLLPLLA